MTIGWKRSFRWTWRGVLALGAAYALLLSYPQPLFAYELRQGQHVFLRENDMEHDRLIGPSGQPAPADRPLSYFIAHEIMHVEHGRLLGRLGYLRLPQWADDGHADYVARDIDLAQALQKFKAGAPELDPARSGLYLRYQLMVAYLIEKRGVDPRALLAHPGERDTIEHELAGLQSW